MDGYSILLKKKDGCFQLGGVNGDDQIGMDSKYNPERGENCIQSNYLNVIGKLSG